MRFSIAVALALALSTQGLARGRAPVPAPDPSPSPIVVALPSPIPSPSASAAPTVPVISGGIGFKCVDCTKEEAVKVEKAQAMANEIVQSKCFGDFMLSWGLIDREGRTPLEVIEHIRSAKLTVPVHYYRSSKKVVGYRQPPYPDIYFNRKYHDYYGVCDTSSNGVHEWSHSIGYGHPFKSTPTRGRTIPYAINNAFDKCCADSKGFRNND